MRVRCDDVGGVYCFYEAGGRDDAALAMQRCATSPNSEWVVCYYPPTGHGLSAGDNQTGLILRGRERQWKSARTHAGTCDAGQKSNRNARAQLNWGEGG
jgi:hypothetical protein